MLDEFKKNPYITPVNIIFVAINVVVYFVMEIIGDTTDANFMLQHGAMYPPMVLEAGQWYRLFTCTFLHYGLPHLINNMVLMICIGSYMEKALGKVKYVILFLASGVGSSLVSMYWMIHTGSYAVSAGASGVVFGLIGALLYIIIRNKGRFENLSIRRFLLMIALALYFGFSTVGVDNAAHVGGLIVGFVMGVLLWHGNPKSKKEKKYYGEKVI